MIGHDYEIRIDSLNDATCDVVFEIRPPVVFASEESRLAFCRNILHLINRRADERDKVLEEGVFEITHNSSDNSSSLGYAKIESLRYGSGIEIFTQALHTALNGHIPNLYDSKS